jgi:uncharacterized protein (TIGR03435 family)
MRLIAFLVAASSALAQNSAPPAFEVASVKINPQFRQEDRSTGPSTIATPGGSLTMHNVNMRRIVAWAYHVQWPEVIGPAWIDSDRYDILAKVGKAAGEEEMRPMLQALLAERFHLAAHRETRQMEALVLLEPKGGLKMTPSQVQGPVETSEAPGGGKLVKGIVLADLAEEMAHESALPIVDMTGLKGRFDITFNPEKYVTALRSRMMADPQHVPPESELRIILIQDLLAGDLGLRLESRKAAVEVVVIDRADKVPVEN